jgi:hypothetical protein
MEINESKITRLEIITKKGREFVNDKCKFNLDIQDNGKTLKIFVEEK